MAPPTSDQRCYLADLTITDFAVIDRLQIALRPGLSVITGETGAGKSIIIGALGAALGDRASSEWIRAGAERAWVEAVFAFPESVPDVAALLAEAGSSPEEGNLFLRREVMAGRSIARFNGRAVPSHSVEQAAARLVDIHSQGDHVALVRARAQLDILDRFGQLLSLRAQTAAAIQALLAVRQEIRDVEEGLKRALREEDLLRHEVQEIDGARLGLGEEEDLSARRTRLKNALRLRSLVAQAQRALTGEQGEAGALDLVGEADMAVRELCDLDPKAPFFPGDLITITDGLETLHRALGGYADLLEDDQGALDEIEERLLLIADLKRKYGPTVEAILAYRDDAEGRLALLADASDRMEHLGEQEVQLAGEAAEAACELSERRAAAAARLSEAIEGELADLGMTGARFQVALRRRLQPDGLEVADPDQRIAFDETGIDQAEFSIAANPGEPERPLGRVASGGELSRVMLAVKSATAAVDPVPVLIFDELDQGVGGRMGHVIGEKLWRLSREHQVLCITHLPQVACYGDSHYVVSKEMDDGRATTAIRIVEGLQREEEISLMLGGPRAGEGAHEGARELLAMAERWKNSRP